MQYVCQWFGPCGSQCDGYVCDCIVRCGASFGTFDQYLRHVLQHAGNPVPTNMGRDASASIAPHRRVLELRTPTPGRPFYVPQFFHCPHPGCTYRESLATNQMPFHIWEEHGGVLPHDANGAPVETSNTNTIRVIPNPHVEPPNHGSEGPLNYASALNSLNRSAIDISVYNQPSDAASNGRSDPLDDPNDLSDLHESGFRVSGVDFEAEVDFETEVYDFGPNNIPADSPRAIDMVNDHAIASAVASADAADAGLLDDDLQQALELSYIYY